MLQTRFLLPVALVGGTCLAIFGHNLQANQQGTAGHTGPYPDVIVGDIHDLDENGTQNGQSAYSFGTTSCNVGTSNLSWISFNNQHPVIGSNLYRLKDGRFEMLGMSWLKHGFTALTGSVCNTCTGSGGDHLSPGCSDPYSAWLNGFQTNLGPRSEINAYTGGFPYPPILGGSTAGPLARRLVVDNDDVNPAMNGGARYFAESQYITSDDSALLGHGYNNVSWREVSISGSNPPYNMNFVGSTQREESAIEAWKSVDPGVTIVEIPVPNDGSMYLGYKVTAAAGGGWDYDYTVYNRDSDRSARAIAIPVSAGANLSAQSFVDPEYHSGEVYVNTDWFSYDGLYPGTNQRVQAWVGGAFNANPNNNALRWGTSYSFHVHSDTAPVAAQLGVILFKPGGGSSLMFVSADVPQ
ncbi:MAG: hypothetical protein COA70_06760 [Planctomycetota bacterium]|nr:MAG: hypothetical protein COA70_06760 [Planctomycetota bacterium]